MKYLGLMFLVLFCSVQIFAADVTNEAVNIEENKRFLMYYGTATFGAAGGTDDVTTQWMLVDFVDWINSPGTLQVWATDISGTEDYNGYVEFSNTTVGANFFYLTTDSDLDQIGITVKWDTVGVALGKKIYGVKYMRLRFDGQTGNPNSLVVNWYITFVKPDRYSKKFYGANQGDTS